jgi:integrase
VPLRARVIETLEGIPRGFGQTPVLLSRSGGRVELEMFRNRHWNPALKAAGIDHRGVYACRHTFATWSIRAASISSTSRASWARPLRMIDKTYGHLAPDAHAYIRGKLAAYDGAEAKEAANG